MPKAGYRDLAKLAEQTQDYKTAVASLEKYLEVAPDAWDKKFVLKKLSKLKKNI